MTTSQRLVSIGADLHGAPGLQASVYAQGVPNAAAMAFDGQGRLWVATAAHDDGGTDAVYLVDAVGSTPQKVIADAHTPLGILWIDDTLYVAASGGVEAYTGFDGTRSRSTTASSRFPTGVGEVNGLALSSTDASASACRPRATRAPRRRSTRPRSCRSCPTAPTSASTPAASALPSDSPTSPTPTPST